MRLRTPVLLLLGLALAGCGSDDPPAETAATPAPAAHEEEAHAPRFEPGHSKAVRAYYGDAHAHEAPAAEDGLTLDSEADYHQPPQPATGGVGDTITLTGTNLGVRMDVTVTGVRTVKGRTVVRLRLTNSGIAIFESPFTRSYVVDASGARARATTACAGGLKGVLRIDVGEERSGCLAYRTGKPERLQLALEQVPAAAGGRWALR